MSILAAPPKMYNSCQITRGRRHSRRPDLGLSSEAAPLDKNGILIALSQSDRTAIGRDNFVTQSGRQKVFSSIWALEAEVNNGVFSQYFFNDSRETAGFAVEALESVSARQAAEICRKAI